MTIRYYMGDADDLKHMTREEVIDITVETYEDAETATEDYMNESMEEVTIGTLSWPAGTALKRLDPVAFRVTVSEWASEVDTDDYPEDEDDSED